VAAGGAFRESKSQVSISPGNALDEEAVAVIWLDIRGDRILSNGGFYRAFLGAVRMTVF
jgi:hypothetical protein